MRLFLRKPLMEDRKDHDPARIESRKHTETSGSYWNLVPSRRSQTSMFFDYRQHRLSNKDVADKLHGDQKGVEILLNALTAMGLLEKNDNTYSNTLLSSAFLVRDASRYIGHIILHIIIWWILEQTGCCG